jgi:hydrophobic/amphiphilic exporter-1 (mainly G- bacteria), HAE1 family
MCLVALLVVGVVAYARLQIQAFPTGMMRASRLWVNVDFPGMSPQEIDRNWRQPIEERMRTVKNYKHIESWSSTGWGLWMGLEFRHDADLDLAYNQMMDRMERAKLELPEEMRDNVNLWKFNAETDMEIMWMGVKLPDGIDDPHQFLEVEVKRPIERILGVAQLNIGGADRKEVMVEVDREQMSTHGVSNSQLIQSLRSDNFTLSGGYVREGGKKIYVRSAANYRSIPEVEGVPVRLGTQNESRTRNGAMVKLGDLADIQYKVPERRFFQRIDGKPAVSLGLYRDSGANIVDVCNRVEAAIPAIEAASGAKLSVFFNQGSFVKDSVSNVRNTATWGGLFAAMILMYFLRTVRMTALITLAMPLCIMITMLTLYTLGWSLNMLTMMGMMVGLGMVVDNAIVIVENIYRMRAKGLNPHEAAVEGASEVGLAITMATLTTVVVFLPLMLMGGRETFELSRIGIPVVSALLGSLLVALIFIPLATKRFGGESVRGEPGAIVKSRALYTRMLGWFLTHRRDAVLAVIVLFATIIIPKENMKKADRTGGFDAAVGRVQIRIDAPPFFEAEDTKLVVEEVESFVDEKREAYGVRAVRSWYRKRWGGVQMFMEKPPSQEWWYTAYRSTMAWAGFPIDSLMSRKDVLKDLKKSAPRYVGVKVRVDNERTQSGTAKLDINLFGEDFETLVGYLDEVERRISGIESVVETESDLERGENEIQIRINRDEAQKLGISPEQVGRSIGYIIGGTPLPRLQGDDREINVRLRLNEEDRKNLQQLKAFTFRANTGEDVALSSFASFDIAQGSGQIRRKDGKLRLRIRAIADKDDVKTLYGDVDEAMEGFTMPRGYFWDKGERYSAYREQESSMNDAMLMAGVCVFLLMGVLFESFILPFCVILSIPFSFLGVYWTLYLTGTPYDTMAGVGTIVLIGVVVNNAIVLVDMINRLIADGYDRREAILEAGRNRYRPILMTTFTTVFGLLPMAVGTSQMMGMPYAPLGRTMMGGLVMSTLLTLLVVPLFYTFLDDLRSAVARLVKHAFSRNAAGDAVHADD